MSLDINLQVYMITCLRDNLQNIMTVIFFPVETVLHTLKTDIPVEEGDCISKLLRRVSRPEIQLGVAFPSELETW